MGKILVEELFYAIISDGIEFDFISKQDNFYEAKICGSKFSHHSTFL